MSAVLTLVANDWTILTNSQKEDLLDAAVEEFPTSTELESLGTFKVVSTYPHSTYMLNFIPKDKLVLPKATFGTNFENIDSVIITQTESGNGKVRYIITDDLTNYYTWDNANQEFVQISSLNAATVLSEGMTATTMGSLTTADWNTFFDNTKGIGIGFALSIDSTTDKAEIDNMSMQVDMRGKWKKAVHGTDYDYAYTSNELLTVTLNANGTYKINYATTNGSTPTPVPSGGSIASWQTGTSYNVDDLVIESNILYRCLVAHTSSVFATDYASGKWTVIGSSASSAQVQGLFT